MRKIVLISCASKKAPRRARARDLYISPLFRLNLAYATKLKPDAIYVLSAKYGLVPIDDIIEPYDLTLNSMSIAQVRIWADRILLRLWDISDLEQDHFVFLAGERYRRFLLPHLRSYEVPLEGLPIGKQLQYLKEATRG